MADSSNTARNFLLIGALLGVGAAAAGAYIMNSAKIDVRDPHVSDGNKAGNLSAQAAQLKENALAPRQVADVAPEGALIPRVNAKSGSEPRYTPLFFAPKLWQVTVSGNRKEVEDLMRKGSTPVYGGVENSEFFKYGLENILGAEDALTMDSDGDGFSNGEEFASGTNPNDKASMPAFASQGKVKMAFTRYSEHKRGLVLGVSFDYSGDIDIAIHDFAGDTMKQTRTSVKKGLKEGDKFGFGEAESGPLSKDRFKVVGLAEKTTADGKSKKCVVIEDTFTKNEEAKTIRLAPGLKDKETVSDVSVQLIMTAGPAKSDEPIADTAKGDKKPRRFQLGETFDVPGFPNTTCSIVKAGKDSVSVKVNGGNDLITVEKAPSQAKK